MHTVAAGRRHNRPPGGHTAFFNVRINERGLRTGHLVEYDETGKIFTNPSERATEEYITGRFG